ncbi:hypothetical protein I317_07427 [Kwoniella heveanensis CBS 569]|uniref:BZIP domain-containing protein n=1 Tax=Kwoniella heveanensis BCC8398 TaxID=1296120 RepID=A0A1B9GR22_9TREE|nr:hypothetical protein I316_05056 [Kwoniella heveanensis BCC8398]OCF38798.1 hypothetical protein I317_07427 [Kwoniella heveanensis CBS 569]
MSDAGSSSAPPSANTNGGSGTPDPTRPKDRHEPRGRKPNDQLPPSRAREVQRAFRLRRAEHLASLEERILQLEQENNSLRALLNLPIADRGRIGSGPTGRGKSLKEGGVPMSERVRARKEARERERRALGLPEPDTSEHSEIDMDSRTGRDSMTLSPRASVPALTAPPSAGPNQADQQSRQQQQHQHQQPDSSQQSQAQQQQQQTQLPTMPSLFTQPESVSPAPFNYQLPMPFNLPVSPDPQFTDFTNNLDTGGLYKQSTGSTPNFGGMFSMFDTSPTDQAPQQQQQPQSQHQHQQASGPSSSAGPSNTNKAAPISPPISNNGNNSSSSGFDLLTRLKQCCHVSDSHVVNDPGLLVFATRLCQSFGCSYHGSHVDPNPRSDMEHLTLEDSWRALKMTLDPGGDADGENRINTGKMAAELVVRAAHSRGAGGWIMCRYREGLSIKRSMIAALVTGLGGKMDV